MKGYRAVLRSVVLTFVSAVAIAGVAHSESALPDYNRDPLPPDPSGMSRTAAEIAGAITLGWNLGNTLEAIGGETAWGNPVVTEEQIRLVRQSGFDGIRLPVSWHQYANATSAKIDPDWLDRVKEIVGYCIDNDLYVILNIHWDGGWLEERVDEAHRASNIARQRAYWQQIATHLREFDERLMFAGANEPNVDTKAQMKVLDAYHQAFVDAVRETGGRNAYRVLIVQGPGTDIEKTAKLWKAMPTDTVADRLMMELHFYTPYNFTLMTEDADWGNQFYYWGDGFHSATDTAHNPTWGEEAAVEQLFAQVRTQFVDRGIPVLLGEFGAMRRSNLTGDAYRQHLAARVYYLGFVANRARAHGLLPFYWDSGGLDNNGSGIFDRRKPAVYDTPALKALHVGVGK